MQAQINDLSDKLVEVVNKQQDAASFTENQDNYMRQFQETLNTFEKRLTALKFDEAGFNERCVKIFSLFDQQKAQNTEIINQITDSEKQIASQRASLKLTLDKAEKEADVKFKRLMVMESSINGLKQEIDLVRVKRLKDG